MLEYNATLFQRDGDEWGCEVNVFFFKDIIRHYYFRETVRMCDLLCGKDNVFGILSVFNETLFQRDSEDVWCALRER